MSTPLKDFRCAITESIDIWLDAVASATGRDKQEVARDVLSQWARTKQHEHKVAARRLAANGLQPEFDGMDTADDGSARHEAARHRR